MSAYLIYCIYLLLTRYSLGRAGAKGPKADETVMRLWLSTAISYECEIIHPIIRTKVCLLWIVYSGLFTLDLDLRYRVRLRPFLMIEFDSCCCRPWGCYYTGLTRRYYFAWLAGLSLLCVAS